MRTGFAAVAPLCSLAAGHPVLAPAWTPVPARAPAPDTSWVARSAIYEIFVRDFSPTGDFRGVIGGLDRVQAVGSNVVWLMPIYPIGVVHRKGPLGSPYAVRDYHAVDAALGTAKDFRAVVEAVHARGMKIILDWVPNHTAWDNVWVQEHPDFYVRNDSGGLTVPRDDQGKLTDWTDVAQLDYRNPRLRGAMIDAMPRGGMRLRFTTNHDETAWDNPPVTLFGGASGARAAFVAMALLPGRPLIYNGQGVESPQKLGLFVRDPIAWDQPRAAEALAFYRGVMQLVRADSALVTGGLREVVTSAADDVIAYRRGDAVVLVNTRPHDVPPAVTGFDVEGARDLLSNRAQHGPTVTLPAYGVLILARRIDP